MLRISILGTLGLALVLAPVAAAHVGLVPERVDPGSEPTLVFTAPDEGRAPLTGLSLELPEGFDVEQVESKPGWRVATEGRRVSWSGGRVAPGQLVTFAVNVTAPERADRYVVLARERFADGSTAVFRPALRVEAAPAVRSTDEGARTLGKAALGVGIAAALLALGAGFLALYTWLRSPS